MRPRAASEDAARGDPLAHRGCQSTALPPERPPKHLPFVWLPPPDAPAEPGLGEPPPLPHAGLSEGTAHVHIPGLAGFLEAAGRGDPFGSLVPAEAITALGFDFPDCAAMALSRVVPVTWPQIAKISVSTDGSGGSRPASAEEEPSPPAWAAVVVAKHRDRSHALIGAAAGTLEATTALAARSTSHSAELVAATWASAWALAWAFGAATDPDIRDDILFEFWSDNKAAIGAGAGQAHMNSEAALGHALRNLRTALEALLGSASRVRSGHVPGHAGHPWNEVADRLADAASNRRWPSPAAAPSIDALLADGPSNRNAGGHASPLDWAWLAVTPAEVRTAYPPLDGQAWDVSNPRAASSVDPLPLSLVPVHT